MNNTILDHKLNSFGISAQIHQKTLQFDTRTGHLTLPVNLATADIVAIIKGLTV